VDSKQTFEELEEENHFRDPDLLLPNTVTREQIYQQHLDSLAPVRQYSIPTGVISDFMNGIINGHLNNDPTGLVNGHVPVDQTSYANIQQDMTINFSSQSTTFSSQQTLTSLDGADNASKPDFAGHDFHSLPFETVTEAVSQTYVNGMHMETFQITSAFSVEDIKITSDSNGQNLKDGNVDFSEWLHDDPTIDEEGNGRECMGEKGDTDESIEEEETAEGEVEGKKERHSRNGMRGQKRDGECGEKEERDDGREISVELVDDETMMEDAFL